MHHISGMGAEADLPILVKGTEAELQFVAFHFHELGLGSDGHSHGCGLEVAYVHFRPNGDEPLFQEGLHTQVGSVFHQPDQGRGGKYRYLARAIGLSRILWGDLQTCFSFDTGS